MSTSTQENGSAAPRVKRRRPAPGTADGVGVDCPAGRARGCAARGGIRLGLLAAELRGTCDGEPDLLIHAVAGLDDAAPGTLVRVEQPRHLAAALAGPAAALLVEGAVGPVDRPCIRVESVRLAYLRCLELFDLEEAPEPGVHPTAVVAPDATLGAGCSVGPYAVIGSRSRLGDRVAIHAHAVIGSDVEIGTGSVIFPGVVIYARCVLGAQVRVHAGAVLGADGYGYEWTGRQHAKRVHNGRVRIGDEVEIGANTTIDRATTGETVIGRGTKIDNLVQIGHNVRTGAHCLIIGQAGIAGSAVLGDGVVQSGQVAIAPHVRIGDGARIAGQSGVWRDLPPGQAYSGNPARPHGEELRIQAALSRLPELSRRVRELERRLEERERTAEE